MSVSLMVRVLSPLEQAVSGWEGRCLPIAGLSPYGQGINPAAKAYNRFGRGRHPFGKGRDGTSRCGVRAMTRTTLAEELCKPIAVHLVGAFVRIWPSLIVSATTVAAALRNVNEQFPCLRPGEVQHQARACAVQVKTVLSQWRHIAVHPEQYARAILTADAEQKRTIIRLTTSIKSCCVTSSLSDVSTTTVGASQRLSTSAITGSTTSSLRTNIDHDQPVVVDAGEFDLLHDGLPLELKNTSKDALEELRNDSPHKRRKPAVEDDLRAFLAARARDEKNAPINRETQPVEEMPEKEADSQAVSARAESRRRPFHLSTNGQRTLCREREASGNRAAALARWRALKEQCSREEALRRAKHARAMATKRWDNGQLWG